MAENRPPRLTRVAPESVGPFDPQDYEVLVTSWGSKAELYFARVKVKRRDGRMLFPFDGCSQPGPFKTAEEAREAGHRLADFIVSADISNPE